MTDWSRVYLESYGDLVRFLYRKVWDSDQAQDMAQEAFVRSLKSRPENPRAWVFQVARNLLADEARRDSTKRRHLELLKNEFDDVTEDPSAAVQESEKVASVGRALGQLSDRDREALLLWSAGFDYEEIAEQTGLGVRSVGTTLARARRKLVKAFRSLEGTDAALG